MRTIFIINAFLFHILTFALSFLIFLLLNIAYKMFAKGRITLKIVTIINILSEIEVLLEKTKI